MNPLADLLLRPAARLGAAAQNALEIARFGGLETGEEASAYDVVHRQRTYRLRRYTAPGGEAASGPPVVLVPPLMLAADVYDVSPAASAVTVLREHGADPWVVDFGTPEQEDGGLERTLADHVVAVGDAVARVRAATGRDVHLGGYSQGGMFCYQAAAHRRNEGIASLVTFGSPVDTLGALPFGIPEELVVRGAGLLSEHVLARTALPAWASRLGFRLLNPVRSVSRQLEFLLALHDREALLPRERQRQFIEGRGWVAWPGPALADFVEQFVTHNRMLSGGFVIEDRLVTLADLALPVLTVVGEVDEIAPTLAVRAITRAAPRAHVYELALPAGHFGLVVGSGASRTTWPLVARWARWASGDGELPPEVRRVGDDEDRGAPGPPPVTRVNVGLGLATGVGAGIARSTLSTATRAAVLTRTLTREAARQLPRLERLQRVQPGTRISAGLLLDERARAAPAAVAFVSADRAHTHAAVKARIDGLVRGLLGAGVRQGEHVGVLMRTRPGALVLVAALSRVGAVGVLLRPDGALARELEIGGCTRVIADPGLAPDAGDAGAAGVLVLGAGGRDLGPGIVDIEQIDPGAVRVPDWYRPNPGRAGELAFVLFTGEGERTRAHRITNGRWALSAFGTAASAALSAADTVYAVTPIYHPSGLLMSVGGAVAGGARLAFAENGFDPGAYWDEVRRYGVTVASYTWTMLRELVERAPGAGERHHPVRLFIGSGMPRGLWRRVEERFAPARVLEFYTSAAGEATLVNVAGAKPGAKGRQLPGSAELRLAAHDVAEGRLREGADGFALECACEEVGMLLARERPGVTMAVDSPLRGVFERGDAWLLTGDLFRRDLDGDFWLVDDVRSLIRTAAGPVPSLPIAEALGDAGAVDLAVAYGVAAAGGAEIAVAAVTQRRAGALTAADIEAALAELPARERPQVVHVVREIPLTTWYRPLTGPLRERGLPRSGRRAWIRDGERYRQLAPADRARLVRR